MKAELKLHLKKLINDKLTLEMKLWEVEKSTKYPDGIRYSPIVFDSISKSKVLMDNHSPKGPHYHLDHQEFDYAYSSIEQLLEDFRSLVRTHMGAKI